MENLTEEEILMTLIWYPNCSTCRRAKAWLDEHNISYTLRDIKEQNPTEQEIALWHNKSGLPLRRFFNTSGLLYKGMALKDKLPGMTQEQQYALLGEYGMLVKRPILVADDFVLVGFREAEWSAALG